MRKYRIKELKNKVTGESRFKLQVKFLWWWNDCYRELGWGCSEPIVTETHNECLQYKEEIEERETWES